jgi:hypothetical protein
MKRAKWLSAHEHRPFIVLRCFKKQSAVESSQNCLNSRCNETQKIKRSKHTPIEPDERTDGAGEQSAEIFHPGPAATDRRARARIVKGMAHSRAPVPSCCRQTTTHLLFLAFQSCRVKQGTVGQSTVMMVRSCSFVCPPRRP